MGTQVTLTLPDSIYKQVEAAARRASRPVSDVLVDVVADAFPVFHVHPQREQMLWEQEAYARQREEIIAKYEGQYIAMHGGVVVDHDLDETELVMRIQEKYPDEIVHLRLVTRAPDRELRFRSPRFID